MFRLGVGCGSLLLCVVVVGGGLLLLIAGSGGLLLLSSSSAVNVVVLRPVSMFIPQSPTSLQNSLSLVLRGSSWERKRGITKVLRWIRFSSTRLWGTLRRARPRVPNVFSAVAGAGIRVITSNLRFSMESRTIWCKTRFGLVYRGKWEGSMLRGESFGSRVRLGEFRSLD